MIKYFPKARPSYFLVHKLIFMLMNLSVFEKEIMN